MFTYSHLALIETGLDRACQKNVGSYLLSKFNLKHTKMRLILSKDPLPL